MRSPVVVLAMLAVLSCVGGTASAQHELTGELSGPTVRPARAIVVVAGATGRTGRLVIEQLQALGRYEVRALARDPGKARREIGAGYTWLTADVTRPDTLAGPLRGAAFVICAIGATARSGPNGPEFVDYGGVRNLVDSARRAGVRRFVLVSSIGAGGEGGLTRWILNTIGGDVLVWKARGERHLRASGVPYVIVRPGGLRDGPGDRTGLRLMQGDTGFGRITRADTARVVIATLDQPAAVGKTFEVVEDEAVPVVAWRQGFTALRADSL